MVEPPYQLTNKGIDKIDVDEYDKIRQEMMTIIYAKEGANFSQTVLKDAARMPLRLSEIIEQAQITRTFWYSQALSSPTGLFRLFYDHIQPLLSKHRSDNIGEIMPFYWEKDVGKFVATKLADKRKYDKDLQLAFVAASINSESCI